MITGELLIILALILANGVFSLTEFSIVSARRARLEELAENGDAGARAALDLAQDPAKFLSTVQIGMTVVSTLAGAFGGATLAGRLAVLLAKVSLLEPYSTGLSVVLVVVGIAYFSLVIGELVPKRIALAYAERIASRMARPIQLLAKLAAPFVWVLSVSTSVVLRVLRVRPHQQPEVTEEEVKILLEHGTREGIFEPIEEEMVGRVFRFGDQSVSSLSTPRPEIVWLDVEDTPEEQQTKIKESIHSYFPVAKGDLDNLLGLVHTKDLLAQCMDQRPTDLRSILREPIFVPEGMRAIDLLERFKETRSQFAVVVDEYGSLQGIITPTDILEALVGEIPASNETAEPEILQREDGSWLVDGGLAMDDVEELLQMREWPEEGEQYYQTLGGFIMTKLGRIPITGDQLEWQNYRFEVVDMDGRRVDKVLIVPTPSEEVREGEGI